MKQYFEIADVTAREIIAAGGVPSVEVEVTLDDSTVGRASVPAGMPHEKPASVAADNVNIEIAEALLAMDALSQPSVDKLLLELDGTDDASRLGANALLAVSLACAKAAAESAGLSLYNYIGGVNAKTIPVLLDEAEEKDVKLTADSKDPDTALALAAYPTLTAFLDAVRGNMRAGKKIILTAGGAETEDPVLADLGTAVNADGIISKSISVYNQLLRIEEELFDVPEYPEQ